MKSIDYIDSPNAQHNLSKLSSCTCSMRVELLSPAKNLECGLAAINNGADAIYIGAQRFGARSAAGNSLEDIKTLTDYAHQFDAKVYVTTNTIIYDDELESVKNLLTELYEIGVDAVLVQDLSIVELSKTVKCPPLHASTQMDIRTPEKVEWLKGLGFKRVVLARELSLPEIHAIHKAVPDMELEAFVHGALCVSYSGQCYASQYCFGRSANRGECAQFCRLRFNLVDADNHIIEHDKYLLSLKDMNRIDRIEDLIRAGVVSLKIEGRLKDSDYVKNVTAAYSQALDAVIAKDNNLKRASAGKCTYGFTPDLNKTFNRGYTNYFLDGRSDRVCDFNTPKAKGEYVGDVKEIGRNHLTIAGISSFSNGDGLCSVNKNGLLEGFRVNRAEGNKLYPHKMPEGIFVGVKVYRNSDAHFQHILATAETKRKLSVKMEFGETATGFYLTITDETRRSATETIECPKEKARLSQISNIRVQLTKLGNTIYHCEDLQIILSDDYFIPSSYLSDLRRRTCEAMKKDETPNILEIPGSPDSPDLPDSPGSPDSPDFPDSLAQSHSHSYLSNISNHLAAGFYSDESQPAFELQQPEGRKLIMQCKHCILFALGKCRKRTATPHPSSITSHLYLSLPDKRRFPLEFDCKNCQMLVYAED